MQLSNIERKIENCKIEVADATSELTRFDQRISRGGLDTEAKVAALTEQLDELRKNFSDATAKKEWAEAKLAEMQSVAGLFEGGNVSSSGNGANNTLARMSHRRLSRRSASGLRLSVGSSRNYNVAE